MQKYLRDFKARGGKHRLHVYSSGQINKNAFKDNFERLGEGARGRRTIFMTILKFKI